MEHEVTLDFFQDLPIKKYPIHPRVLELIKLSRLYDAYRSSRSIVDSSLNTSLVESKTGRGTGSASPDPRPIREPARRTRSCKISGVWGDAG
ncbi:hypothetical protein H5410_047257 [Solanum commersonii]|uniref:Uncharacterized protein n=1 Tax=Solanum commersonii TaxID=4109 RepID=A0A9J5XGQ7_SOLCO|nr:hypothetical protein H5410_047257 [Solanum commersonii]